MPYPAFTQLNLSSDKPELVLSGEHPDYPDATKVEVLVVACDDPDRRIQDEQDNPEPSGWTLRPKQSALPPYKAPFEEGEEVILAGVLTTSGGEHVIWVGLSETKPGVPVGVATIGLR